MGGETGVRMTTSMSYLWSPHDILLSRRVDRLSSQEECWYRRALDYSWIDGGLSCDPTETAKRIGKKCTPTAAQKLLSMFFIQDRRNPEKMVNEKQEELRKKLKKKLKNLSNNGKLSGQKRRQIRDLTAEQMLNKGSTDAEQKPSNKGTNKSSKPKEEAKASSRRGTRIPEPFLLTKEMREWSEKECPQIDLKTETQRFVNYYRAKTGQNATKLDWRATWENWILGARDKYGVLNGSIQNGNQGHRATSAERLSDHAPVIDKYAPEADLDHIS
jgi:hypothetical protein